MMDNLKHCTPKQLAEVFGSCQDEIISEWRLQASVLLKLRNLDKPTITNHLPELVEEITRDLAVNRNVTTPEDEDSTNSPPKHGVQRFKDGLDVGEVVAEYNLLRIAFITVAERHHLYLVGDAMRIINQRIDDAVRLAVMAFATLQALMRKEQEDMHLAFVAHDLRTPLNAVSLLVQELKYCMDEKAVADTQDVFDMLGRNLNRVETLIKRVLETNTQPSLVGGSFRPVCRSFELWPLAQRLIHELKSVSSKHSIEVVNEIPPDLQVFADAGLLSQVFQNLLGNAFEYAAQGKVIVRATDDGEFVNCLVTDNGAGIPLDLLDKVFDKLVTDPDKKGTGLGLVIVKQIVEAHGGQVNAVSTHGAGATFSFTLPAAPLE